MEAKTKNRCSRFATGGFADTREVLMLLGDESDGKEYVDSEDLVMYLTRLKDFMVERGVKEPSPAVYDPNRVRVHWELYALIHVIFSDTNRKVYLHNN